jgi:hypothetical protein
MSTQVQYRRGTEAQNNSFVGALAEITVDTTNLTLRVHDGITAGGSNIATVSYVDAEIGNIAQDSISNGTSSVAVIASGGNVRTNIGGSTISTVYSSGIAVTGLVSATTTITATGNVAGGNLTTAGQVSATGNITGGNLITAGLVSLSSITKTGSNGVGNIGSSTSVFNTVFAKATSAQYADLAEKYQADRSYPPGTVLEIGGSREVTETTGFSSTKIAGVVSTDPAFIMNSGASGDTVVQIALLGRVPCRVIGTINRGDLLCSSDIPGIATALSADQYTPGSVIGKALADYDSDSEGQIEILVGRL